jgi:hypothetical protein
VFHPTFEGHLLQLQDLPHQRFTMPPARLLRMDVPVLPPLDLTDLKSTPPPVKPMVSTARLALRLSGPLALRAMVVTPDLGGITLTDPAACRYQVGVNADGLVEVLLALASSEPPETMQKLRGVLHTMRFAPASLKTNGPVWGTATFEWTTTAP